MKTNIGTKWLSIILILTLNVFMLSCGNSGTESKSDANDESMDHSPTQVASAPIDDTVIGGEEVYNEFCAVCHQEDGSGFPEMFPPLVKSETVSGDHAKLIKIILEGMEGVEINGVQYDSSMLPHKDELNDQQIADVLNFLRNSFENSGDKITAEEVAALRN